MTLKPSLRANEFERFKDVKETVSISATDSSSSASFSSLKSDTVKDVLIQNLDGTNEVYVNWGTTAVTAATTDARIGPLDAISLDDVGFTHFAAVCSSTETAIVRVTGISRNV